MSSVYVSAPPTQGKIVLHTSLGPIDVELWSKETPRTSRNFVQLCMEGYYDNTIFHRAIKDFMLQGGDPTGTGTGGESIYGEAFKDEIHSRLRFAHRGIVAMANTGPNTNNSQFFITLDKCDWIEKQYTIFGKVTGDSIYNLIKANSLATDKNDRPLYPPKLLYTEVIWNPFDDIEPRVLPSKKQDKVADQKPAANRIKNKNLLSFGDEVGDDEEESVYIKKQTPADKPRSGVTSESQVAPTNASSERSSKAAQPASVGGDKPRIAGLANRKIVQESEDSDSEAELTERDKRKLKEKEEREKEMKRLKREIKKIGKEKEASSEDEAKKPKQSFLQMQREKFRQGKHHLGDKGRREAMTLKMLQGFKGRLATVEEKPQASSKSPKPNDDSDAGENPGAVDHALEANEDKGEENGVDWMAHRLVFEKESRVKDPMLASAEDDYVVLDPRQRSGYAAPRISSHQQKLQAKKKLDKW